MSVSRYCGIIVSGTSADVVVADYSQGASLAIQACLTWVLPDVADRCAAYHQLSSIVATEFPRLKADIVLLKESAVGGMSVTSAHLFSAELRGVVKAVLGQCRATVKPISMARISRTFGSRKAGEYLKDDSFWTKNVVGNLPKGYRAPALMILDEVK